MKAVLSVAVGVMCFGSLAIKAAEVSASLDSLSAANAEDLRFPSVSLSDLQAYAPSDKTDWIDGRDLGFSPLPRPVIATSVPARRMALITNDSSKDLAEESFPVKSRYYVSGEMGAAYGVSTGKYGAESESGYIIGTVGNDKFEITAGTSYENTTFHAPRFGH